MPVAQQVRNFYFSLSIPLNLAQYWGTARVLIIELLCKRKPIVYTHSIKGIVRSFHKKKNKKKQQKTMKKTSFSRLQIIKHKTLH